MKNRCLPKKQHQPVSNRFELKNSEQGGLLLEIVTLILFLAIALPGLINLYVTTSVDSALLNLQFKALRLCEEKLETVYADKINPSCGFSWIVTNGRYPSETPAYGFTRTTTVDTAGKIFSGIRYAAVTVSIHHSRIGQVQLTCWMTPY